MNSVNYLASVGVLCIGVTVPMMHAAQHPTMVGAGPYTSGVGRPLSLIC